MKPVFCFLLIICLFQLMISTATQCNLDSLVTKEVNQILNKPGAMKKLSCTSVKARGKLASCPAGAVVTGCACGYGCGSWDVRKGDTCHCQCHGMDWTPARCCRIA